MNTEEIKVSVIVPVYNAEKYLHQCMESIMNQTLKEIEIICVDDGSADSSPQILQEYSAIDSRLMILRQRNSFAGVARNNGMKQAKGEYLCFLDSDDFFDETLLEKMYAAAKENASDAVICNHRRLDICTGIIRPGPGVMETGFLPLRQLSERELREEAFQIKGGAPWEMIFRKGFVEEHQLQFSTSRTANDAFFVLLAICLAKSVTKIEEQLITYRVSNAESLSHTKEHCWYDGFQTFYDIEDRLRTEGIYTRLEKSFLNHALRMALWLYRTVESKEVRENIRRTIIHEAEARWRIRQRGEDFFMDKHLYKQYCYMMDHSFQEYDRRYSTEFPWERVCRGSRVVLYGAGEFGSAYYRQLQSSGYAEVVFWCDRKYALGAQDGLPPNLPPGLGDAEPLSSPVKKGWINDLGQVEYDYIVIAMQDKDIAEEVKSVLLESGVKEDKII